jgi:hypothetical protein
VVLDFKEIYGTHSGENLADAVEITLVELGLEGEMSSELFHSLPRRLDLQEGFRVYKCCLR